MVTRRKGDYSKAQSTFLTHKLYRLIAASATPTEVPLSIGWNLKENRLVLRWNAPARKRMACTTEAIWIETPFTHLS